MGESQLRQVGQHVIFLYCNAHFQAPDAQLERAHWALVFTDKDPHTLRVRDSRCGGTSKSRSMIMHSLDMARVVVAALSGEKEKNCRVERWSGEIVIIVYCVVRESRYVVTPCKCNRT
jgi:hypothetical protein